MLKEICELASSKYFIHSGVHQQMSRPKSIVVKRARNAPDDDPDPLGPVHEQVGLHLALDPL